jgi:hypothetical protein
MLTFDPQCDLRSAIGKTMRSQFPPLSESVLDHVVTRAVSYGTLAVAKISQCSNSYVEHSCIVAGRFVRIAGSPVAEYCLNIEWQVYVALDTSARHGSIKQDDPTSMPCVAES